MSNLLILPGGRNRDRPPTAKEVSDDLRRMFGNRGVFETVFRHFDDARPGGLFWTFVAALCDPDDQYCPSFADPAQLAERTWTQRDHVLTGLGIGPDEPSSHKDALACAHRGNFGLLNLTVWFDRGSWPRFIPKYCFFRRAPRIVDQAFRPASKEIPNHELLELIKQLR
jgi:hypothetical protein